MFTLRFRAGILALFALAACKVDVSGAIPCTDDSNCPGAYPQCMDSTGSSGSGRCAEAVSGTPVAASSSIDVSPVSITGGLHPAISLALPAVSGNKNLVRKVTLEVDSGGAKQTLKLSGGDLVTVANLGSTVTIDAPDTS